MVISTGVLLLVVVPSPRAPRELSPQHFTEFVDVTAHECASPPVTLAIPEVRPDTETGVLRVVVVPSPSRPEPLDPQHLTAPDSRTAQVWKLPEPMLATPEVSPVTSTGAVLFVFDESPNSP